ncbi:Scr1 family TA system antitoxin-like transcriptional regulator [Spirillospora sp. NPDC048911]|uniref:helix-turn-helix domain-containing protein n=1 Tax=Spirillospora sp. NPDC048911 TaxID=3364527 RepID=UPI003710872B
MSDEPTINPFTSLAAYFAYELRHSREDAGLSQDALAGELFTSRACVSAYETENRRPGKDFAIAADKRLSPRQRLEIIHHHARREHNSGWLASFLEHEQKAYSIKAYEGQVIHGLLQTDAYARAMMALAEPKDLDRAVAKRLARQAILDRTEPEPPYLWLLLDQAVLMRPFGGREVMYEQLGHALEIGKRPRVTIQIVPFDAGVHWGVNGDFWMFDLVDRKLGYNEAHLAGRLIEDPADLRQLDVHFDLIRAKALSEKESRDLITDVREQMR